MTAKDRLCMLLEGRAYCGRKSSSTTLNWGAVTCADCWAGRRADEAVAS